MSASVVTIETPLTSERFDHASEFRDAGDLASQSATAKSRLRLTRRGRVVFGTLGALAVLAAFAMIALLGGTQAFASAEESNAEFGYVVVQPGASLWQIAAELDPSSDPRDLVAEIVRLNQLNGSGIDAGQPIAVPLRFADTPGVASASELGL